MNPRKFQLKRMDGDGRKSATMNTTRKRNLIIFLFLIFIGVGLYLLADSPVGDSFMEGFEAGYRGEQPPK